MENKRHSVLYYFLAAALAVCPFVIDFTDHDGVHLPGIAGFPRHIEMEKGAVLYFAVLVLVMALSRFANLNKKEKRMSACLAVFFALCVVFGRSYEMTASWEFIFGTGSGFIASVAMTAGYAIVFYLFIGAFITFINGCKGTDRLSLWLESFLSEKSLVKIWLALMLCWLPYIIINYPGVIHADSGVMLGESPHPSLFNHHPVVQTVFWGSIVEFGHNIFGSYNIGVFIFVLIQYVYGSFITALFFDYVYKKKYPVLVIFISFCIIAFSPAFARHSTAVCKDSNHTFYFMLMLWLMARFADMKDALWTKSKNRLYIVLFVLTLLLVAFSKKSGIYVVLLTAPFMLMYFFRYKKCFTAVLVSFVVAIGVFYSAEYAIENVWDIGNDDTKEIYSIPFQQTGRFVRDYAEDVTDEERDIINAVLDYDSLGSLYSPELCDPIKNTFKTESTDEEFSEYMGTWFRMFFRHPTVYLQATLNNVYGYFYPENVGYYKDLLFMTQCVDENKIFAPQWLKDFSYNFRDFEMKLRDIPVIGLSMSLGFYVWLDIFIMVYFMLFKRDKKFMLLNVPVLVTLLICVASPANNTMRYGLPIMFAAQILICMCFKSEGGEEYNERQ